MAFKVDVQRLAQCEKPAQIKNISNRHTNTDTLETNTNIQIYIHKMKTFFFE